MFDLSITELESLKFVSSLSFVDRKNMIRKDFTEGDNQIPQ